MPDGMTDFRRELEKIKDRQTDMEVALAPIPGLLNDLKEAVHNGMAVLSSELKDVKIEQQKVALVLERHCVEEETTARLKLAHEVETTKQKKEAAEAAALSREAENKAAARFRFWMTWAVGVIGLSVTIIALIHTIYAIKNHAALGTQSSTYSAQMYPGIR